MNFDANKNTKIVFKQRSSCFVAWILGTLGNNYFCPNSNNEATYAIIGRYVVWVVLLTQTQVELETDLRIVCQKDLGLIFRHYFYLATNGPCHGIHVSSGSFCPPLYLPFRKNHGIFNTSEYAQCHRRDHTFVGIQTEGALIYTTCAFSLGCLLKNRTLYI